MHVRAVTGIGINTWYNFNATGGPQAPFCLHYDRVSVLWTGSHGIVLNNSTDSVFHDVYVLGVGGCGWWMSGAGNSSFTSCRAEWSSLHGFDIESVPGVIKMVACSTDRNGWHGMYVHATDTTGVLLLSATNLTRDGKNNGAGGGGYAGLGVADSRCKVMADGLVVLTGKDDDGTGWRVPSTACGPTTRPMWWSTQAISKEFRPPGRTAPATRSSRRGPSWVPADGTGPSPGAAVQQQPAPGNDRLFRTAEPDDDPDAKYAPLVRNQVD